MENKVVTLSCLRRQREELLRIAVSHHAQNVRVFGSVARGQCHQYSDVDFLVCFEEGASLLDLTGLIEKWERLLGRRVDVVSERALNRFLRKRILAEAVPL